MKLWHWVVIGAGAWWLLRKKAVAGPPPVGTGVVVDPAQSPTVLLEILRTKFANTEVRTYGSGSRRGEVEIYFGSGTEVLASLPLAIEWAKAQPFSKVAGTSNWTFVP